MGEDEKNQESMSDFAAQSSSACSSLQGAVYKDEQREKEVRNDFQE